MGVNYQKELEQELSKIVSEKKLPRLLLHSCCGPCSSYVLEYLSKYFDITVYYYNPNIFSPEEFEKRAGEQMRLLNEMAFPNKVDIIIGDYIPEAFQNAAVGFENEPEGSERCKKCFELRLEEAAKKAVQEKYDYFCTTLSVSPHKNSDWINEIGLRMQNKYGVKYLFSDFKKREGYKRSIELSNKYGLYRQNYCGCEYSYRLG